MLNVSTIWQPCKQSMLHLPERWHPAHGARHSKLASDASDFCHGFTEKNQCTPNSPHWNALDSSGTACWKSTDVFNLKVVLQTIWEELSQEEHIDKDQRWWKTSPSAWLLAWLPMEVTSSISTLHAVRVHLQACNHQNRIFSEPPTYTSLPEKTKSVILNTSN